MIKKAAESSHTSAVNHASTTMNRTAFLCDGSAVVDGVYTTRLPLATISATTQQIPEHTAIQRGLAVNSGGKLQRK